MRDLVFSTQKNEDSVLKVSALTSGYKSQKVIKDITFELPRGTFAGLLGPNGSGKTTLLLTITGILRKSSGYIELLGKPIESYTSRGRARHMAAMPQETFFYFPFTCEDIVWMGRYPWKNRLRSYSVKDFQYVKWAMDITKTSHLAKRLIFEVSGGEKQRILLARLLAQQASLFILDEPTSNMDVKWTLKTFELLKDLCLTRGISIIASIHDINTAASFCDRLLLLKEGTLISEGSAMEVLKDHILEEVYETKATVYYNETIKRPQVSFLPETMKS